MKGFEHVFIGVIVVLFVMATVPVIAHATDSRIEQLVPAETQEADTSCRLAD